MFLIDKFIKFLEDGGGFIKLFEFIIGFKFREVWFIMVFIFFCLFIIVEIILVGVFCLNLFGL